ncbi:VOC family protein [Microbaculum marinum]|uniref:VOC family protein n=1 Tax=Microbaculum marinum TaxID=1764581 RepID=A0AAW9RZC6_9HYPH
MSTPPLDGILETALYVDDLDEARAFYLTVMGLDEIFSDERMASLNVGEDRVLLLFRRGASAHTTEVPGGTIPPHDGAGPVHIAFAVDDGDLAAWEEHLERHDTPVEARTDWPERGTSIYFRDPDGHLLELASRRLWRRG